MLGKILNLLQKKNWSKSCQNCYEFERNDDEKKIRRRTIHKCMIDKCTKFPFRDLHTHNFVGFSVLPQQLWIFLLLILCNFLEVSHQPQTLNFSFNPFLFSLMKIFIFCLFHLYIYRDEIMCMIVPFFFTSTCCWSYKVIFLPLFTLHKVFVLSSFHSHFFRFFARTHHVELHTYD